MFKKYTYKQKFKWLWISLILMVFICYQLSIKRTIEEYSKYKSLLVIGDKAANGNNTTQLKARLATLESTLSNYKLDTSNADRNLLKIVTQYCSQHDLYLKEYKPAATGSFNDINLTNRFVIVEGGFNECLRLVYELETNQIVGRLSSVHFKSYEDKKDGSVKLNCIIYVQNII